MLRVRLKSLQIMTLAIVGVPFLALDSVQAEAILPSAWLLAQTAEVERITGFYMNIAIFLPALALFVIWVPTVWWIDDDSFGLGLEKRAAWITASVLTGIIGLLVMLLVL